MTSGLVTNSNTLQQTNTCENMCKCVSACDLQCRVFGSKHIQEEGGQAAQYTQETEGSNHPQQQDSLRVHAVI